jgi:hypothetical protein
MRQAYEAACVEATGEPPPLGQFEDEPDWAAEAPELVEFLHAGPCRPFADQRRQIETAKATGARQREELVRWAVTAARSNRSVLDRVGPAVREEALRRIEAEREERLAAQLTDGEVETTLLPE